MHYQAAAEIDYAQVCAEVEKKGSYPWARPLEMDKNKTNKLTPNSSMKNLFFKTGY